MPLVKERLEVYEKSQSEVATEESEFIEIRYDSAAYSTFRDAFDHYGV